MIDWNTMPDPINEEQKQELISMKWYRDELTTSLHKHFLSCEGLGQEDKANESLLKFQSKTSIRSYLEKQIREDFLTTEDTEFISQVEKCISNQHPVNPLNLADLDRLMNNFGKSTVSEDGRIISPMDLLINTMQKQIDKNENIEYLIDSEITNFLDKSIIIKGKSVYVISDEKIRFCLKKIEEFRNEKK